MAARRSSLSDKVARERIVSGSRPLCTNVLAARIRRGRDQGCASRGRPELTMRNTSSHGRPGLRRRTSGTHWSALALSFWKSLSNRATLTLRMAAGSAAFSPGLPQSRASALAGRNPALVRSRIWAHSNSSAAPRTWRANLPYSYTVSNGSCMDRKCVPLASKRSVISKR